MKLQTVVGMVQMASGPRATRIEFTDRIVSISEVDSTADLPLITPGLVDTHCHGLQGMSVSPDADSLLEIANAAARNGVTRTILSVVSSSESETIDSLRAANSVLGREGFVGLHLEGPFIATSRCGAHKVEHIRSATERELETLLANPALKSMTIAPEAFPIDFVSRAAQHHLIAVGHTDCDFDTAAEYFSAGAKVLTHALNAMPPLLSRAPGPLGAALNAGAGIELIADGHHLHPATLLALFQAAVRPLLVTDSIAAAGMPDMRLSLGEVAVEVRDGVARREDDGALAGSTLLLKDAMFNLIEWGADAARAIEAATTNPATIYGIPGGNLTAGAVADLVVWDGRQPASVFRDGQLVGGQLVG